MKKRLIKVFYNSTKFIGKVLLLLLTVFFLTIVLSKTTYAADAFCGDDTSHCGDWKNEKTICYTCTLGGKQDCCCHNESCGGGESNTGGNSCTATYTLTPSSPLDANTNFSVKMSNVSTPYNRCTMIFNDGQPSNNCRLTDNGASTTCDFNSGSAGSHTIQAKFGQGQYYSGVDCGNTSYNCNSTTYTTNSAPACAVTWHVPATVAVNTNFIISFTQGASNVGWNYGSLYLDGTYINNNRGKKCGAVSPGDTPGCTDGDIYFGDLNSGAAGRHTLTWKVPNRSIPGATFNSSPATTCTPSATFTSGTPPGAPTVTPAACITSDYDGSGITISWANSNPAVTYVDISTVSNFASWYNKPVSGTSTNASGFTGMPGTSVAGQVLVFQPNTTYYVRVWNGALSGVAQFNITTTCVVSCSVSGDIDGNGRIELADFDKWKNAFVNGNSIINVSPALNNCEGVSVDLVLFNTWRSQFARQ